MTDASCDGSLSSSSARCKKGLAGLNSGGIGGKGIVGEVFYLGLRRALAAAAFFAVRTPLRRFFGERRVPLAAGAAVSCSGLPKKCLGAMEKASGV